MTTRPAPRFTYPEFVFLLIIGVVLAFYTHGRRDLSEKCAARGMVAVTGITHVVCVKGEAP